MFTQLFLDLITASEDVIIDIDEPIPDSITITGYKYNERINTIDIIKDLMLLLIIVVSALFVVLVSIYHEIYLCIIYIIILMVIIIVYLC